MVKDNVQRVDGAFEVGCVTNIEIKAIFFEQLSAGSGFFTAKA